MLLNFDFVKNLASILAITALLFATINKSSAQCDCAYPVIFLHGFTGDYTSYDPLYTDANFMSAWGGLTDTYDAIINATTNTNAFGADNTKYTSDDDAIFTFANDPNNLQPGCLYAMDFSGFWNQNTANPLINNGTPTANNQSESNQAATEKQGWALGEMIKAVLAANPDKTKVVLSGHSMGGLAIREYLQRFEGGQYTWWADPTDPVNGHKVAKAITVGTPHRGSNLTGLGLGGIVGLNERSEAVRDLRYSYACGFLNLFRCRAPYLFGDMEDPHIDVGYFHNGDTDCDGDYDTQMINSLNSIGSNDPWDGTTDNPAMPLPTNIKYTYYTSDGDFVVADERQWIYSGGNGSIGNYNNGNSVPVPNDGVSHRLTDIVMSVAGPFHTSETGDLNGMLRSLDEADYPIFAYEINTSVDYSGFAQQRADKVPAASEFTNAGDNTVDGDWYKFKITANTPGFAFNVTPHPGHAGRADFYDATVGNYSNNGAALTSITWAAGAGVQAFNSAASCFAPGTYYMRITHVGMTANSWQTPYKFRVDEVPCVAPTALMAAANAIDANFSWTGDACATGYTLQWREVGTVTWNTATTTGTSYTAMGLLPDKTYEYQVSSNCGGGTAFSAPTTFSTLTCPNALYIPSLAGLGYVPMGIYEVGMFITSDGYIDPSTNVTYEAGQSIELMIGFESGVGANFLAHIVPCMPTPFAPNEDTDNMIEQYQQDNLDNKQDENQSKSVDQEVRDYVIRVPQPDGSVNIVYQLSEAKSASMSLRNENDQVISKYTKSLDSKSGKNIENIDLQNLKPGSYMLDFKYGNQIRSLRLVKRPVEEVRSRL